MFELKEIGPIDDVKSPRHYRLDGLDIESKDVIRALLGEEGHINWCWGNVLKYVFRWKKKDGLKDLKKAREILDWIIDIEENKNED